MPDPSPFTEGMGQRIRERRKELGLSLQELADRMDMSKVGVWQVEKGTSMPGAGTLWRLSRALRITIDEIVTGGMNDG